MNTEDRIRHRILLLVSHGRLTVKEAEEKAARRGMSLLAAATPIIASEPLRQSYWTLFMVLGWISRKEIDVVRQLMDGHRSGTTYWMANGRGGVDPEIRDKRVGGLDLALALASSANGTAAVSLSAATRELHSRLAAGLLRATAVSVETGAIKTIEPAEWQQLELHPASHDDAILQDVHAYERLRFDPRQVIENWPATLTAETGASAKTLPATVTAMKKTISSAQKFMKQWNFLPLTKTEAEEDILEVLHSGSQQLRRSALEGFPTAKKRPSLGLINRKKELADCREFLMTAT